MNYEKRVVLFLDILGFKQIIEQTESKGIDIPDKIETLYDTLSDMRRFLSEIGDRGNVPSLQLTQFSDAILVSFLENEESQVLQTLYNVQYLLVKLCMRGIICRGGIAYGKLVHNKNLAFGPALIQAYETESDAATFPRVILDRTIINIGKKYHGIHKDEEDEADAIFNIVIKDTDDMYYVNYFPNSYNDFGFSPETLITYISTLKNIIQQGLRYRRANIKSKYGWMKNKYNAMVKAIRANHFELPEPNPENEDLIKFYQDIQKL